MNTVIEGLRQILGTPDFYDVTTGAMNYAALFEYFFGGLILCIVVTSVFRFISKAVG